MRIAVMGLGGVGGFFAGKLAKAYKGSGEHEVIFIARGEHLQAIKKNGLKIITPEGEFSAFPDLATANPVEAGRLDLVIFCVKSYGLEEAAKSLAGAVRKGTVILPLLNGVDITERLQKALPDTEVLNGAVYISAALEAPGVVRHKGGAGQIVFGPERNEDVEKYRYVEDVLRKADIKADLQKDAAVPIWTKYIFICPLAGLTSAIGKGFGAIMSDPQNSAMLKGLMEEVYKISKARGVHLPDDIVNFTMGKVNAFPPETKTSMQLDYEKGSQTELEIFTGYIVKSGKELGIPTPLNEKIYNELQKKSR